MASDQIGDRGAGQQIEDLRIAEKAGDVDQEVLCQEVPLGLIGLERREVEVHTAGLDGAHRHASFEAAP